MSTKICPYCAEKIQDAAIKCRYCATMLSQRPVAGEWYRDTEHKMIGGVASGLARQFGITATAVRIAFIIAALGGGWGFVIYIALWIIMPVARTQVAMPPLPTGPPDPGDAA